VRVAALYDVHGNLPALDAVLAQVPDDATIVLGGDIVVGPFPAETLARLRDLGDRVVWIRGNADRELTPGEPGTAPPEPTDWVRAQLAEDEIAFLYALPPTATLDVDGLGRVLFCHATPHNDVDIFTALTPEEKLRAVFADADADVVVCGHTHIQFDRRIGSTRVVNAGSVGMAYEDEPGAYWALLGPDVEFRHEPYELDTGEWPEEWPAAAKDEAQEYFETLVSF
jgi:putative phosphoesterase